MAQGYRVKYADESIFISGLSEEASNFILVKMDLEGNVIWDQSYGGNSDDHCFGMDVNPNGEIFLVGHTYLEQKTGIHTPSKLILMENCFGSVVLEIQGV